MPFAFRRLQLAKEPTKQVWEHLRRRVPSRDDVDPAKTGATPTTKTPGVPPLKKTTGKPVGDDDTISGFE